MKKLTLFINVLSIATCSIVLSGCKNKNKLYEQLIELTTNFKSEYDYSIADELLDKLPNDYKNVNPIKEEYFSMRRFIVQLSKANLSDNESESSRASFKKLFSMKNDAIYWDISSFLDNPSIYDSVVYGKFWGQNYDNFYWRDGEAPGTQSLSTTLSNKKKQEANYYFYMKSFQTDLIFGYRNTSDSSDVFDAYAIKFVAYYNDQLYLNIRCYSENFTYTLYAF